ncbi:MAG: hypothetical protein SCK57_01215 [Bacillota bacterium]|nr:hypothetical protein [Bacillota bacterium]MDW7676262.1 hypothetical protein [Bacillota bacterium]
MVYLRVGTRLLFIRSTSPDGTCDKLMEQLKLRHVTMEEGLRESDENTSLLFITPTGLEVTDADDARHILLSKENGTGILSQIINKGLSSEIQRVDLGPRILILRVPDNEEKVLTALAKDYHAQVVTWKEGVRLGEKDQTLLGLTTHRLHQALGENAIFPKQLLIDQPLQECYAQLRREALLYITHSLKDGSWFEYRINLFDMKERYELHYQRLILVIAALEMGLILGENWTRDHALALMSVLAYQVRLFSFLQPNEVKQILIGLEYDGEGRRLADFDLYHRNKKVAWTQTQKDVTKLSEKRNKKEEGIYRRNELLNKLTGKEQKKLLDLENMIKTNV